MSPPQEQGILPGCLAVLRCKTHATVKALENAFKVEKRIQRLIDMWIKAYSSSKKE